MSRIRINRNKARLKAFLGIRARLVLFALILVGPLMVERIRALHEIRNRQIEVAIRDFAGVAQHSAEAQREVISSVEAVLKSSAFIYTSSGQVSRSCAIMGASLRGDMPWIRSLTVASASGVSLCSIWSEVAGEGVSFADRLYFQRALASGDFVVSDYLFGRITKRPSLMAAYLAPATDNGEDAVIIAAVNLDWMSKIMNNLGGRAGVTAALVDAAGTVLAAPSDEASTIGRKMGDPEILAAIAAKTRNRDLREGTLSIAAADGTRRAVSFAGIPGTSAQLIVSIDEDRVAAAANRDIRTAYLQLGFICLFILLGALVVAERLIIQPIRLLETMAKRFGVGDWSARSARSSLPAEFIPLARAFNNMAAQLGKRERDMLAANDRLAVMASIDTITGIGNRRGFQSRLDFEWAKAQQTDTIVALLMIDVDHFKPFNDTYGHLEGDACLGRIGAELAAIAAATGGFASRYGGEEFCLLLPHADIPAASQLGELVRSAVQLLAIPHATGAYQRVTVSVGVAAALPARLAEPKDLIEAADAALYAAKRRGRNTVVEHGFVRAFGTDVALAG